MTDKGDVLKFEDQAIEVVLEKRERSYSFGEPRTGPPFMALINQPAANLALNFAAVSDRLKDVVLSINDKKAIRDLIEAFEKTPPNQVIATYGRYTLDPYTSVQEGQVLVVNQNVVQQWVNSPAFAALSNAAVGMPEIVELLISFVDESTASVSYSIEQGGLQATSAAIVVKDHGG
jgi:hypothetical protein